jgi:DNA polymerase III subunit beta
MTATMERAKKAKRAGCTIPSDVLQAALETVGVVSNGATASMANVLIGNGVCEKVNAEMRIRCAVDYYETPAVLLHSRLLAIAKACQKQDLSFSVSGSICALNTSRCEWKLPTEDASVFPAWLESDTKRLATIPASQFAAAVKCVSYACDKDSSRYALGGVLIEVSREEGKVYLVATDGRRLSRVAIGLSSHEDPDSCQALVPINAIQAMQRNAEGSIDALTMNASATQIVASIEGTTIFSRLVEGRFPKWRDVFPQRECVPTIVNRSELLAATRQAAIVTSEQSKGVRFVLTEDGIDLTARSSEAGESSVTCPLLEFGQAATVSLDPQYVVEFLRACDEGQPVEIDAVDAKSAVVLRCGDYHGVIMPLAAEG